MQQNHTFYVPINIALHTGLRAGEVCALTWDKIDFDNKRITVDKTLIYQSKKHFELTSPKTEASIRTIAISDTLIKILKEEKKQQAINKLNYGQHYTDNQFVCRKIDDTNTTTNTLKYLSKKINYDLKDSF